jgi:hypothetical protein
MNLDEKLREVLENFEPLRYTTDNGDTFHDVLSQDEAIARIKQIILEETGIDEVLQNLVNLQVNMKHDMIRLGLTYGKSEGVDKS